MKVFSAYDEAVSRNGIRGQTKSSEKSANGDHKVIRASKPKPVKEAVEAKEEKIVKDDVNVSPKAVQKKAKETPKEITKETPGEEPKAVQKDIANNDPNDPVTKEKLKAAINSGLIKFSDSERGVLKELMAD